MNKLYDLQRYKQLIGALMKLIGALMIANLAMQTLKRRFKLILNIWLEC